MNETLTADQAFALDLPYGCDYETEGNDGANGIKETHSFQVETSRCFRKQDDMRSLHRCASGYGLTR